MCSSDLGNLTTTGSATVAHGLNKAPSLIITKSRNNSGADTGDWAIQHSALTSGSYILRFDTTAQSDKSGNGTLSSPTSSVFYTNYTVGLNVTGNNYVAYCWAEIPGLSKFGSYTGNGSADGPVVITGFKPAFIMIKGSSFISNWFIQDNRRNGYNPNSGVALRPNLTNQEDGTTTYDIDILSNGFKLRSSAGDSNTSTATFIYAAFAEAPSINLYGAQANAR